MLLLSVGMKPITEEVLFRGFLYDSLAPRGIAVALLGTSAVFSLAHWLGQRDAGYALAVLPLSLALGGLRAVSRGVGVPAAFHIVMNVLLI
jgi:membrane protease YdiL (CAAX protease family)